MVNKKKMYQCDFCEFTVHQFANLKQHIRKNHLEKRGRKTKGGETTLLPTRARSDDILVNECTLGGTKSSKTGRVSFRARSDESLLEQSQLDR